MLALMTFFFAILGCSAPTPPISVPTESQLPPKLTDDRISFRPAVDFVPENNVTVRIAFPESIQIGGQRIRITDQNGERIEGAMRRWAWDEARRVVRLEPETLKEGQRFAVSVEGLVTDAGEAIPGFSKFFVVRSVDATPPDGTRIQLTGEAKKGTTEPLTLVFDEPVRWTSLGALSVLSGSVSVVGHWSLGPHQTRATFQPEAAWDQGPIFVSIGAGVSDLAGNQLVSLPTEMLRPRPIVHSR